MKSLHTLLFFWLFVTGTQAQTALESSWITNGRVNHIAKGDGKVFLIGEFNWFGPAYYGGTASFSSTLVEDQSYPKIEQTVMVSISDDAGGVYAGVQDQATNTSKIIHIRADKSIEELPVTLGAETWLQALAKAGNILYFGGYFESVNGTTRNNGAAINLTNNTLTSWNPNANSTINVLTVSGSTVYAGGSFNSIGGQTRTFIAALDAITGLATSWNVTVTESASVGEVSTILVNAGVVYFGGYFGNVNAATPSRRHFAAVNAATGALETFNPRPDGWVRALLLDGGMLYMAGGFDEVLGISRFRVARIELATSTLTPFELIFFSNTHSNFYGYDQVNAIGIEGNKLFIGGTFPTVNNETQPHLAVLNKVTGVLEPSEKKIYGEINTLLVNGGNVFAGGYIRGHLGTSVNGIAVLDETTGAGLPDWTHEIPSAPEGEYYTDIDFHYQNDRIYFRFNASDDTNQIGALDAEDGSLITSWSVTVNHPLNAWAFSDDALYLADQGFDPMIINGQSRERFAAVDLETGALLPWTIDFPLALNEHYITSMAIQNDALYAAGAFTFSNNGVERNSFAAWSATTGTILPWSPRIDELDNSEDPAIGALTSSRIYLVGNGAVRRVHPTTGVADSWEPAQTSVGLVAVHNNSVFLAGGFEPGLLHVDGTTAEPAAWQPDFENIWYREGSIDAIAVASSKLLMSGNFSYKIDGHERYSYAEFLLPGNTNSAPVIESVYRSIPIQGMLSIYLPDIITDAEDNLDLSTATIISQPFSGAIATIAEGYLIIDYNGLTFSGTDNLILRVCDTEGACAEEEISIELSGEILVYNAISANGDSQNDRLRIQNIESFGSSKVSIFNRWGDMVFEITDYNNNDRVFKGVSNEGKELPSGVYYYKVELSGKTKTGYLSLKR